jgi:hypothetical protein
MGRSLFVIRPDAERDFVQRTTVGQLDRDILAADFR